MPFIWDDNQYMLLDEEDQYDKSRFVIARKLFITRNREDAESMVSIDALLCVVVHVSRKLVFPGK